VRELLDAGPLDVEQALDVARQAAEGLAKAHEAGIVHRDLKPENLMVTEDGLVKILDFGLAKLVRGALALDTEGPTLDATPTRAGTLLGTVEYMSPEQASSKSVDLRTDHFALGLVVYEMITGERPFQRETVPQTLAAIIEAPVARLDSQAIGVSAALADVVERCLAKQPEERFATTAELVEALRVASRSPEASPAVVPAPALARALVPVESPTGDYHIQTEDGTRRMRENKLRRKLRRGALSGLEMVRRDGEDVWVPLHDRRVFREEVPTGSDPREAARWRVVRGFGGHLAAFAGVGVGMTLMLGEVPFWMAFWGIGLITHAFQTAPAVIGLIRRSEVRLPGPGDAGARALGPGAVSGPSASFVAEVERVRGLVTSRPASERKDLLAEIDRLVSSVSGLIEKERDLEEQTSPTEVSEVRQALQEAEAKLAAAGSKVDRQLFRRQVDVLSSRRKAIDTALVQLERMRVRREMAEHQLKQLRLDLSQAEARRMDTPELSSRILRIRHEVDAFDEVEEALASD
jgi:hypothetical protein